MQNRYVKTTLLVILLIPLLLKDIKSQTSSYPSHIAVNIKTENIKFSNNSIKITWEMNSKYTGDFIVGRSEKEILTTEDVLKAKLVGIYNSGQEGILIDRDVQQGKEYYYIVIAKDYLVKRKIEIYKNINYTAEPVSLFVEPDPVRSIRADISDKNKIMISWGKIFGSGIRYNVYRSRSPISSAGELGVADKISTTEKNEFIDTGIPDYGSYFYAVTVTDRNGIEYYTPKANQNYTSNGIFIKGKTLTTPLNVGAFIAGPDSIIIKWEKSESKTGKELQGYEIYRSDEIINTLLKLKFSKLIKITDVNTLIFTDKKLNMGKYCYAVFPRYSDGTVDINFETDSNYTKTPLIITKPYRITAVDHEIRDNKIIIKWNYTGNNGNETVSIFKTSEIPQDSAQIMNDYIIGTENIKAGKFTIKIPSSGSFYYGVLSRDDYEIIKITRGVNLTGNIVIKGTSITSEKTDNKNRFSDSGKNTNNSRLDNIIRNTYYKGKYSLALKELKKYIKSADNKYDLSKAKLFLAKSYIELQEYENSIKLLDNEDVKSNFPEETKFWFEFALVRLK